jgi:hypothetical protein
VAPPLWSVSSATASEADRRAARQSFAPTAAALAAFVAGAVTSPVDGRPEDAVVLHAMAAIVDAARRVGGAVGAACGVAVATLSYDFFHVHPLRSLHAVPLLVALVGFGAVALAAPASA